jgi:hypothetical protein
MKIFYHDGRVVDKSPVVSYKTLESGKIVVWYDKTINSLIDTIP